MHTAQLSYPARVAASQTCFLALCCAWSVGIHSSYCLHSLQAQYKKCTDWEAAAGMQLQWVFGNLFCQNLLCVFNIRVLIIPQDIVCHLQLIRSWHRDCSGDVFLMCFLLHLLQLHCSTLASWTDFLRSDAKLRHLSADASQALYQDIHKTLRQNHQHANIQQCHEHPLSHRWVQSVKNFSDCKVNIRNLSTTHRDKCPRHGEHVSTSCDDQSSWRIWLEQVQVHCRLSYLLQAWQDC